MPTTVADPGRLIVLNKDEHTVRSSRSGTTTYWNGFASAFPEPPNP